MELLGDIEEVGEEIANFRDATALLYFSTQQQNSFREPRLILFSPQKEILP